MEITGEGLKELGLVDILPNGYGYYLPGTKFPVLSVHRGPVTENWTLVVRSEHQSMTLPVRTMEDVRKVMEDQGFKIAKPDI